MATETRTAAELKVSTNFYREGYIYTVSHIEVEDNETLVVWVVSPRRVEDLGYPARHAFRFHKSRPLTVYV